MGLVAGAGWLNLSKSLKGGRGSLLDLIKWNGGDVCPKMEFNHQLPKNLKPKTRGYWFLIWD